MKTLLPRILKKDKDPQSYKSVEELDEALQKAENDGVRNIALTGPYGSGKSSVLNTLKHDFKNGRNYLSISLATLQSEYGSEPIEGDNNQNVDLKKKDELNRKIEYSILQQLIYREEASTVPNSRFKRISYFTQKELRNLVLWSMGFIIAFFIAFEPSFARVDSAYDWLNWGKLNALFDFIAIGYLLFCLAFVIKYFIQGYSNSKLNKLNLKDGEIDIREDNSIFNKHLDEILYFFRATNYDVVIIEDLDRFETSDIYLKLRELNQLINEAKEIGRHITFIYAVKDDIFSGEDRTKFFDTIITVIPVINPSNSKSILKKQLTEIGLPNGIITDDDLASIAFFIPDMRMLTNIVNEFQQYWGKLTHNSQHLNLTKLLAMIVYKNYYPKDFASLHRREGMVYQCISRKRDFIKMAVHDLEEKKKLCLKEIEQDKEARRLSITELRKLFVIDLIQSLNARAHSISVKNSQRNTNDLISDDIFAELLNLKQINYEYRIYNSYRDVATNTISVNVMSRYESSSYYKRIQTLSQDNKVLTENLESINRQIRGLSSLPLYKLISDFQQVRESDIYKGLGLPKMINVFFIEGFIDEYYYDYISYFYEGMISPADREFILSIRQLQAPEFDRHIDKIDNFVKELRSNNFISDSILNVELLDYFTSNKSNDSKSSEFYDRMVNVIDTTSKKFDFLGDFCTSSHFPGAFLEPYYKSRLSSMWSDVIALPIDTKRNNLIISIIQFGGELNDKIFDWISDHYSFVQEQYAYIETNRLKFIVENTTFAALKSGNEALLKLVISEYSYTITKDNLCVVISSIYDNPEITSQDITLDNIRNCDNNDVISYLLDENLPLTFDSLNHQYKNESLGATEFILNSNLPEDKKREFLMGQECRRDNIIGLSDEQAIMLYECNLIVPTWENVSILFDKFGSNTYLVVNFIKANKESLSIEKSASGLENEVVLFDLLFGSNKHLTLEEYQSLDKAFECVVEGNEYLKTISKDRFEVLLRSRKIPFDKDNITVLNGTSSLSSYLLFWNRKFIENIEWDYTFDVSVLLNLLQSDKFTQNDRKQILEKAGTSLILSSSQLASISAGIIADNLPDTNFNIAEIRAIISNSDNLKANIKLVTYLIPAEDLDESDIAQILESLKNEKFIQLSKRHKQPKFDRNSLYYNFLHALKEKHYISSISGNDEIIRPNYHRSK